MPGQDSPNQEVDISALAVNVTGIDEQDVALFQRIEAIHRHGLNRRLDQFHLIEGIDQRTHTTQAGIDASDVRLCASMLASVQHGRC